MSPTAAFVITVAMVVRMSVERQMSRQPRNQLGLKCANQIPSYLLGGVGLFHDRSHITERKISLKTGRAGHR